MSAKLLFFRVFALAALFVASTSHTAAAAEPSIDCGRNIKPNSTVQILFINGIMNDRSDACQSSDKLASTLAANGLDMSSISWDYVHNPMDWAGLDDVAELRVQAELSAMAGVKSTGSVTDYFYQLGWLYKDLIAEGAIFGTYPASTKAHARRIADTTKKIYDSIIDKVDNKGQYLVVVPHSQGNFYTEAVFGLLRANNRLDVIEKVKVVGVAAIAMRSPNDDYVTIEQDKALFKLQELNTALSGNYAPTPARHKACVKITYDAELIFYPESWAVDKCTSDGELQTSATRLLHEFFEIYLNSGIIDVLRNPKVSLPFAITEKVKKYTDRFKALVPVAPNNHRYEIINCGTWFQCRDAALAKGGQLVTIRSQSENDWLAATFSMTENYWIGAANDGVPGAWRWSGGETFSYTNWGNNLNNFGGNENCAHLYSVTPGYWNDLRCDSTAVTKAIVEYTVKSTNPLTKRRYELTSCGNWLQCRDAAIMRGGQLVTIRSDSENEWLANTFLPSAQNDWGLWIGLNDLSQSGTWTWVGGQADEYRRWSRSEPNNIGRENYVHMMRFASIKGEWNNWVLDAGGNINQAIVEYGPLGQSGVLTINANSIPGATLVVPNGVVSCIFNSTGTWSAGPQAPPQYQNADGVIGGNSLNLTDFGVPISAAPNMALVVKHSSTGKWDLLGSSKTISVVAGETLSFMMNDATTFGYTDGNTGQLSTVWSCN